MVNTNQIAHIGLVVGEPARAAMLVALMDGRALTAGELARAAGITPQTASSPLARLTDAAFNYQRPVDDPRKIWYPG